MEMRQCGAKSQQAKPFSLASQQFELIMPDFSEFTSNLDKYEIQADSKEDVEEGYFFNYN